jgi:hypothetical protein
MALTAHSDVDLSAVVMSAVRQLVSVTHWANSSFVSLPLFYPGGGAVSVKVETWSASEFRVSDNGFAYREAESLGAERSFPKTASRIATEQGVSANRRLIYAEGKVNQLAMRIAKVGVASWQVAHHICEKVSIREEAIIAEGLYDRLVSIFGDRVKPEGVSLVGLSTNSWEVSAFVEMGDHGAVFDAVAKHRNSIYRTATKFHDLAALENPPRLIAVVRDKEELGVGLALLAQAGRVIEDVQADEVFKRAAAA